MTRAAYRRCKLGLLATSAVVALGFPSVAGSAPPQGTPLMITLPPGALAIAEGANGFVIAGNFFSGGSFHWMPTSGVTDIGGRSVAAVSRDGKTIVGKALDQNGIENAAIWTGGKTWRVLGSVHPAAKACDQILSGAFGANADGKVIVGLAWDGCKFAHAFRWEESAGMVDLGSLSGKSTRANGVSGDGRVVVGFEDHATGFRQGAKWVDGKEELFQGPSGFVGEASAANRDGSMIAGTNCDPVASASSPITQGWTWTPTDGVKCYPVSRPPWAPPRFYQTLMQSMSDDGRVIGGAISFGLDAESVVWFDGEPVFLRDYLRANGVPDAFDGWVNTGFVTDVSADGRTLVGYAAGPTTFTGFMVILPALGAK